MISFFVVLIVLLFAAWALGVIPANWLFKSKKVLKESEIVKKFNTILKNIGERNLDVVKEELIACLDDYSIVKEKQFSFTLAQIYKSKEEIKRQIIAMESALVRSEQTLKDAQYKNKGKTDNEAINTVAKFLYKYKTNQLIMDKLNEAFQNLSNRESELNNMLADFNSNLAVKKAEIAIMVADSTGIFTGSAIDLRLDNLVKEFQDKVIEGKAAHDVHEKLKGEESNSAINFASCVEEAKTLLGA